MLPSSCLVVTLLSRPLDFCGVYFLLNSLILQVLRQHAHCGLNPGLALKLRGSLCLSTHEQLSYSHAASFPFCAYRRMHSWTIYTPEIYLVYALMVALAGMYRKPLSFNLVQLLEHLTGLHSHWRLLYPWWSHTSGGDTRWVVPTLGPILYSYPGLLCTNLDLVIFFYPSAPFLLLLV